MKYKYLKVVGYLAVISISQQLSTHTFAQEVVTNQYIVKYSDNLSHSQASSLSNQLNLNEIRDFPEVGASLVTTKQNRTLNHKYIKDLIANGTIDTFEPNYKVHTLTLPSDPRMGELWGLHNIGQNNGRTDIDVDAPEAWDITTGDPSVVVGVVDTGIEHTHQDLQANVWVNTDEIPGNNIDDDNNGVVDDVNGYNAITRSGNPIDNNGHGTHCAGTIAGVANNGRGVVGVASRTKVMGIKFLDASGSGSIADAISGIEYAINMKRRGVNLRVLSNSWGGGGYSQTLENAIKAANDNGILFVAAAGNDSSNNDVTASFPANYNIDNILSVAAVDSSGNLANFSNYGGTKVHVAAPGVSILSTYLQNTYTNLSGTSMATPHVSGIAALLLARESSLTVGNLKNRIMNTSKPLSSLTGLVRSAGIVSAYRALINQVTPIAPLPDAVVYNLSSISSEYDSQLGNRISQADDAYIISNIGFTFPYYGGNYNKFAVSTNGRIIPLGQNDNAPNTPDFANSVFSGINVFNDDLIPSSLSSDGGVWEKITSDSVIYTWVSVPYGLNSTAGSEKEIKVQLKLTSNGNISISYKDTFTGSPLYDYGASSTVSITPANGGSGDSLVVVNNQAREDLIGNNKAILFSTGIISSSKYVHSDIDGDSKSDLIVWRPNNGMFYILTSSSGFDFMAHKEFQLGLAGDMPKVADFDGDKKADLAVWRPSTGTWFFRTSGSGYSVITSIQWGLSGDLPMIGDTDGDGINDLTVYRKSIGMFYTLQSTSGFNRSAALQGSRSAFTQIQLGGKAHDPILGDFNGDGKDEYVAVWQLVRFWDVKDGNGTLISSLPWGQPGDTPLSCKMDNDSSKDRVITRINSNNTIDWFSANANGSVIVDKFGSLGDQPGCQTDIDKDGVGDITVYREHSGEWFIKNSSDKAMKKYSFGLPGDVPML